jgi:hypothetical protein
MGETAHKRSQVEACDGRKSLPKGQQPAYLIDIPSRREEQLYSVLL